MSTFYNHPTFGEISLVEHPQYPWRLVGYHKGVAVIEMDKPDEIEEPDPEPWDDGYLEPEEQDNEE